MRLFLAFTTALSSTRRVSLAPIVWAVLVLALAVGIAVPPVSAEPIAEKQAQAAALDSEVAQLEAKYADLQERHRGALVELGRVQKQVATARRKLDAARADLKASKSRLEARAVAIYRDGSGSEQLLEVARAGSLNDFFAKLDTIERVGTQDAEILTRVRTAATRVAKQERKLRKARDTQTRIVKRASTAKKKMGVVLGQRQA